MIRGIVVGGVLSTHASGEKLVALGMKPTNTTFVLY
jgi:hypothetical protein